LRPEAAPALPLPETGKLFWGLAGTAYFFNSIHEHYITLIMFTVNRKEKENESY
jgi:hypothetical protein